MKYLHHQRAIANTAIAQKRSLRDVLSIKYYVQTMIVEDIAPRLHSCPRFLEVGCGGSLVPHLLQALLPEASVSLLDKSPEMLEYSGELAQAHGTNVTLVNGDAFAMPFTNDSFDYVLSVGLIEHFDLDGQRALLSEMARCTKRYIHVEVPNPHPLSTFFAILGESDEIHHPCNPGTLMEEMDVRVLNFDGRCVFDEVHNLRKNPVLMRQLEALAPGVMRDQYLSQHIEELMRAERRLSRAERLVHGFQLYWIGEKGSVGG